MFVRLSLISGGLPHCSTTRAESPGVSITSPSARSGGARPATRMRGSRQEQTIAGQQSTSALNLVFVSLTSSGQSPCVKKPGRQFQASDIRRLLLSAYSSPGGPVLFGWTDQSVCATEAGLKNRLAASE